MKFGYTIIYVAPQEKPWGQVVAYVKDLNGIIVELCTSMS